MGQPKKTSDLVRLQARKIRHGTGKEKVGRNFSVRSSEGPEGLEEVAGTVENSWTWWQQFCGFWGVSPWRHSKFRVIDSVSGHKPVQ